ncbi:MAG: threonine synthase, partial [Lysobacterales bacterium]
MLQNLSAAVKPLLVRYDLEAVKQSVDRDALARRAPGMWRYRELLPVRAAGDVVSLGEQATPLVALEQSSQRIGGGRVLVKDEGRLPAGSFRSRGLAVAVSMAKSFGVRQVALPTVGSGGASLAAYCRRAGIESYVFCPDDAPETVTSEIAYYGSKLYLVNGAVEHCNQLAAEGSQRMGWFDMSTLKEPYRIEGKKTMGLELADQFGWKLPDVVFYPTGCGTGFIGMWKAFAELEAMGWLDAPHKPRLIACQSDGCAPIAEAWAAGARFAEPVSDPETVAAGIRVPVAVGDFMILDAVRDSGGAAVAAAESRIGEWMRLANALEGIALCPEAAVCVGVLERLAHEGQVDPHEQVVIFNTGAAQKYVE